MADAFLSTPSARRATPRRGRQKGQKDISIHALREEGDTATNDFLVLVHDFYPRPPRGGRHDKPDDDLRQELISIHALREEGDCWAWESTPAWRISIHALREEGDSKNGEKHLRFCFIIKRSAQIWKSFSKNIRKNSRDLHRTA